MKGKYLDNEVRNLYLNGKEEFENGRYEEALKFLEPFVEKVKTFADVYNIMGICYHQLGKIEEAINAFKMALNINPRYSEPLLNLSITLTEIGRYDEAKEIYTSLKGKIKEESDRAPIQDNFVRGKLANMHAELGDIYRSMGLMNEAINEYEKGLKLSGNFVDIKTRYGIALREKGEYDASLKILEEAKKMNPYYFPAGIQLGITYYSMNKIDRAISEWMNVLKLDPSNYDATMYLKLVKGKK